MSMLLEIECTALYAVKSILYKLFCVGVKTLANTHARK
uniref:Uncharacterized protein n=1 Tax=Anguilla anguilla TaxID=7936 RepID=A0A0E9UVZ3_ANGAN